MSPSPSLFGSSPIEKATIEMFRRKVEFDGMQLLEKHLEIQ